MTPLRLSLAVIGLLVVGLPAAAQNNPFEMLPNDPRILVKVPPGFDLRPGTAELTAGVTLEDGAETTHTAFLQIAPGDARGASRIFSIPPAELPYYVAVTEAMRVAKAAGLKGSATFNMQVGLCRTGPAQQGEALILFGLAEGDAPPLMVGEVPVTGPRADPDFTAANTRPCDDGA